MLGVVIRRFPDHLLKYVEEPFLDSSTYAAS